MEYLYKSIDKVIDCYLEVYDNDVIDNIIMNEIINNHWESNNYPKEALLEQSVNGIMSEDVKKIKRLLRLDSSSKAYKAQECIRNSYEYIVRKRNKYKIYSIYYTPNWIVKYIVSKSIDKVVSENKDITKLRILEPSCGCGVFLCYIFDFLFDSYKKYTDLSKDEIVRSIIENNIYGTDIDEHGITLSKYSLLCKVYKYIGNKHFEYKFNLISTDYLKKGKPWEDGFDLILGNPPYLENRGINKYYDKQYLKSNYETARGRFDIYGLFVEKAMQQVAENGFISFILPASILSNNNFTEIRKLILIKTDILEIINIGENIFNQVGMNMAIITLKKSQNRDLRHMVLCKDISQHGNRIAELFKNNFKPILQQYYNSTLNHVFDIYSSDITFKLRGRIFKHGYTKVNDICEIIAGIATGNIRKKLLTFKDDDVNTKKVLEGKDIYPYGYGWSGLYIRYDKSLIDRERGQYATFMREEFLKSEKLLTRQTADRFISTYDNNGYYILNTLYSMIIRDEYKDFVNLKYVLALLNSKFYSYLYRTIVRESGKLFPQVKIFHIQVSPIKVISLGEQAIYIKCVDAIMNRFEIINKSEVEEKERYKRQIEIEEYKRVIDRLVYELFSLSDREIKEVEEEMGISPLDYDTSNYVDVRIIERLKKYKDIMKVSYDAGVNPRQIYKLHIDATKTY